LSAWWRGLNRLGREAPALVQGTARRTDALLADGDGMAFVDFVAAGLKATVRDKARRAAFFALEDPLAQAWLARRTGCRALPTGALSAPSGPARRRCGRRSRAWCAAAWWGKACGRAGRSTASSSTSTRWSTLP